MKLASNIMFRLSLRGETMDITSEAMPLLCSFTSLRPLPWPCEAYISDVAAFWELFF